MRPDLVLRGPLAITESGAQRVDIVVSGEQVAELVAPGSAPSGERELDCDGLTALPGLIDTHAHHREPGFTYKEDIVTATTQCAAGGVTVSLAMPNVSPPPTTAELLDDMLALYRERSIVDYNVNPPPTTRGEAGRLAERGILAFKVFMVEDTGRDYPHMPGTGVSDHGELYRIMREVQTTGLPLMVHPHDQGLMSAIEEEFWARGERDFAAYARAYASDDGVIWDTAVGVLLRLQQATSVKLHLLHMQTRGAIEAVRAAKAAGRDVTCEVNPWCLWLGNDWENIARLGPYALSYYVPPAHAESVWSAFQDGTIDLIATDHAPHTREDKEPGWTDGWKAHTGTPSVQFYLSLLLTEVAAGRLSLERVAEASATLPAKRFGLYPRKGALRAGGDADIVLVDLSAQRTITDDDVLSKCGWTPYASTTVLGIPVHTILRGRFVFSDNEVVGAPGDGRLATRAVGLQ